MHPAPPEPTGRCVEPAKRRADMLQEHDAAIEVIWGWPKEKAYLPAVNNLSVRKLELQDELIAGIGRIQKETKAKLARLEDLFRSDNG